MSFMARVFDEKTYRLEIANIIGIDHQSFRPILSGEELGLLYGYDEEQIKAYRIASTKTFSN